MTHTQIEIADIHSATERYQLRIVVLLPTETCKSAAKLYRKVCDSVLRLRITRISLIGHKFSLLVNGGVKYTRGCLIDDHTSHQLSEASIELCSTDGCNLAPAKVPLNWIVMVSPILIGFYLIR